MFGPARLIRCELRVVGVLLDLPENRIVDVVLVDLHEALGHRRVPQQRLHAGPVAP